MTDKTVVARLVERRDQFLLEVEALRNKVDGIELAISLLREAKAERDSHGPAPVSKLSARRNISETIRQLLGDAGRDGLSVAEALAKAADLGMALNRASISTLLSRLKRDGVVVYEDMRYKLSAYARPAGDQRSQDIAVHGVPLAAGRGTPSQND